MEYIRRFEEVGKADVGLVGGKGANLGEMVAAGLPVPPGFCLTAAAYREFTRVTGLDQEINDILSETDLDDPTSLKAQAARIRQRICGQVVPTTIAWQILDGYRRLSWDLGMEDPYRTPVAVRSSATAEDLPTASFAGQQETYLNVRGKTGLLERVKDCWASLWTDRAMTYRTRQGFDHGKVYLAVVVQAMIPAEVSGILFTSNPVSGRPGRSGDQRQLGPGRGDCIRAGHTRHHHGTQARWPRRLAADRGQGAHHRVRAGGGTVELATPEAQRAVPALPDEGVAELVALGQQIEAHYGAPQDIEWAHAGGRFYILQSRPITTLAPTMDRRGPREMEYNRTMFVELFPDPLSPVFLASIRPLFQSMLDFTFSSWGFKPPEGMEATGGFYNQPYFNRNYIEAALAPLSPAVREGLVVADRQSLWPAEARAAW